MRLHVREHVHAELFGLNRSLNWDRSGLCVAFIICEMPKYLDITQNAELITFWAYFEWTNISQNLLILYYRIQGCALGKSPGSLYRRISPKVTRFRLTLICQSYVPPQVHSSSKSVLSKIRSSARDDFIYQMFSNSFGK